MKRSLTVCVLVALTIAGGITTIAEEANPASAPAPVSAPVAAHPSGSGKIELLIIPIHHAKASYVAGYLDAAIGFADQVGMDQMLKGKSKALPDDRANQIIMLTAKENMPFFGRIIHALDVPVDGPSASQAPPPRPPAPPQAGAAEKKEAPQP